MPSKTVITGKFPSPSKSRGEASKVVRRTALFLEQQAKLNLSREVYDKPESSDYVRTGFLRNSVQSVRIADLTWVVFVGAEYGIYIELGTRFMRARPYWAPAIVETEKFFKAALQRLINGK
jgi:hypothetical protein